MTNHLAKNLITKGFINSHPLTDGMLTELIGAYVITRRKTGSGGYAAPVHGTGYQGLKEDIKKLNPDEIGAITVYVDWWKNPNKDRKITAEMIENKITVELLKEHSYVKVDVEFLK